MNTYETTFAVTCPVDGALITYRLKIHTGAVIMAEALTEYLKGFRKALHEELADQLFEKFGGQQVLKAEHGRVLIETVRPTLAHWSRADKPKADRSDFPGPAAPVPAVSAGIGLQFDQFNGEAVGPNCCGAKEAPDVPYLYRHALEELHQLGYTVENGDLMPPISGVPVDVECRALRRKLAQDAEFLQAGERQDVFEWKGTVIGARLSRLLRALEERRAPVSLNAARYAVIRCGQHWSVVNGVGDVLRGDALDNAVDAVLERQHG